jgi:hypothetical protein
VSPDDDVERLTRDESTPFTEMNEASHAVPSWVLSETKTFEGSAGFLNLNLGLTWRLELHGDGTFSFEGDFYARSARIEFAEVVLALAIFCTSGVVFGITFSDLLYFRQGLDDDRPDQHPWNWTGNNVRLGEAFGSEGVVANDYTIYARDHEGNGLNLLDGLATHPNFVLPLPDEGLEQLVRRKASETGLAFRELVTLHGAPPPPTPAPHLDQLEQPIERLTRPSD